MKKAKEALTVDDLAKRISAVESKISDLDKRLSGKIFKEIREDSEAMHDYLKFIILQVTTATEISFYGRATKNQEKISAINRAAIWAFDQLKEWWDRLDAEEISVKKLAEKVVALFEEAHA